MKEKIEFRKNREFGEIISDTFLFIKQNFKPLMKVFFMICGLFIVAGMVSMALQQIKANAVASSYEGHSVFKATWQTSIFTWEYLLLIIVSMLNYVSMYITVLSYIAVYIHKGNAAPTFDEVWEQFRYFFGRVLGSTMIMLLFLGLCFAACILPGVYVFPMFTLFYPIMILENREFGDSFSRSFSLLKNEWWATAAVIFVVYIIFYMMSFVIQIPAYLITFLGAIGHAEHTLSNGYTIVVAIFTYVAQVFVVIPIVASAFIYFNLVEKKESSGLLERINNLGQPQNNNLDHPEEY